MERTVVPLPNNLNAPSLARRAVEVFVEAHQLHAAREDLTIIASELVTNAVIHGAEPVVLSVSFAGPDVTVEVADGDPGTESVRMQTPHPSGVGGRGLRIVASIADHWGIRDSQYGKTIWATKSVRLAAASADRRNLS